MEILAYNIFAVADSYGSIKTIDLISENKIENICEIIASPLFNSVLITHKDDIKSIISTNAQYLANIVVSKDNDSNKNNQKISYLVSKFNDFITKNKLAIINKIFQSSIINDISHLFQQANKKEHMKKGIAKL